MGVPGLLYASVNPEYLNSNEGNFDDTVTHNRHVFLVYSKLLFPSLFRIIVAIWPYQKKFVSVIANL